MICWFDCLVDGIIVVKTEGRTTATSRLEYARSGYLPWPVQSISGNFFGNVGTSSILMPKARHLVNKNVECSRNHCGQLSRVQRCESLRSEARFLILANVSRRN